MSGTKVIDVGKDFSKFPGGRYMNDGPFPAEKFRKEHLVPALKDGGRVEIDFNSALGAGSSFLEEAFGGLVREEGFDANDLTERLSFTPTNIVGVEDAVTFIEQAGGRKR